MFYMTSVRSPFQMATLHTPNLVVIACTYITEENNSNNLIGNLVIILYCLHIHDNQHVS